MHKGLPKDFRFTGEEEAKTEVAELASAGNKFRQKIRLRIMESGEEKK